MPYRLDNAIQPYPWGERGPQAFIPRLLGISAAPEQPYAELWMGTHPNAPSHVRLGDERISLAALIAADPVAILGERVAQRFDNRLPFLFKVLSAAEPLSIQAHPNKAQAERLHARNPQHYPDANHKPEVAIALDHLTVLAGIKAADELTATLAAYPEIAIFIGESGATPRDTFAALIHRAMEAPQALSQAIEQLAARLRQATSPRTEIESLFLTLHRVYGDADVGLLCLFLLNLIHLEAGQGLYLPAGVPHAYLRGNLIECMANSDNVVRVGLTPKFKDAEALLEILAPEVGLPPLLSPEPAPEMRYLTPAQEFVVQRLNLAAEVPLEMPPCASVSLYLLTEGRIRVEWREGVESYQRGESFLVPACLPSWQLTPLEQTTLFKASVPE